MGLFVSSHGQVFQNMCRSTGRSVVLTHRVQKSECVSSVVLFPLQSPSLDNRTSACPTLPPDVGNRGELGSGSGCSLCFWIFASLQMTKRLPASQRTLITEFTVSSEEKMRSPALCSSIRPQALLPASFAALPVLSVPRLDSSAARQEARH